MNARRVSSSSLAAISAPVCSCSLPVIRLKAVPRVDLVLRTPVDGDPRGHVALLDPAGGIDQLLDRAKQTVGKLQRAENGKPYNDESAGKKGSVELQLV